MLLSAIDLIRERGVAGVTVDEIIARSATPRGSVYYYFPDGRAQIVREALAFAGESLGEGLRQSAQRKLGSRQTLAEFIQLWQHSLQARNFDAGCPMVAATVDGLAEDPELREPTQAIINNWRGSLISVLVLEGRRRDTATRLANLAVAAVSGAVVLCRVERDITPLKHVAAELDKAFSATNPQTSGPTQRR